MKKIIIITGFFLTVFICVFPAFSEVVYEREVSLGYNLSKGNTNTEQLDLAAKYNRNRPHIDEVTFKGNFSYAAANKEMTAQKWFGLGRYAYSLGNLKKWYNFYRLEASHDGFANIDYRLVPATGVGYWFLDKEDLKFLSEAGFGFQRTVYRDETKTRNEPIFTPRLYFMKKISPPFTISEDLTFYQSLSNTEHYNARSETSATAAINERLSLRTSFIDEFESVPAEGKKRNDIKLLTALVVKF